MQREEVLTLVPARNRPVRQEPPAVIRNLAAEAGISINGDAPWDIQVLDERVYRLVLTKGSLGFGEAYMDGDWDSERLDELFCRLLG
ncbi:MAG TPA: cyclopropane-fatty-acyl-phospholipid synthase, partial [Thiobacillus sp.]